MTAGAAPDVKTIPFVSSESKDGKLILTAGDKTRVTLAVNAGDRFISFRLEKIEDVPKDAEPILNFMVSFNRKPCRSTTCASRAVDLKPGDPTPRLRGRISCSGPTTARI
jgi:hypothetical protein